MDGSMGIRTLVIDCFPAIEKSGNADVDKRARVGAWARIRRLFQEYRCAVRKAGAAIDMAVSAGAQIRERKGKIELKPMRDEAKKILALAFGFDKEVKSFGRELFPTLKEMLPSFCGATQDCAFNQIIDAWRSKDPSATSCTREFLTLQGDRKAPAFFNATIGIRKGSVDFGAHKIGLRILADGEALELALGTLDGGRWSIWRRIVSGEIECCDPVRMQYRNDRLTLLVPYKVREERAELDEGRCLEVCPTDRAGEDLVLRIREGHATQVDGRKSEALDATAMIASLDRISAQFAGLEAQRRACGSRSERHRGSGHGKAWRSCVERGNGLAMHRKNVLRSWVHVWSHRVVETAVRWRCGRILLFVPRDSFLRGRSFPWADLVLKLQYKARSVGIVFEKGGEENGAGIGEIVGVNGAGIERSAV
jgi:hypothetical protein